MGSEIIFFSFHISSNVPKTWGSEFRYYKKIMGKHSILKLRICYIFCLKQKSILFPKHGKIELQFRKNGKIEVRENYRKTQIFQGYGFLTYFTWKRNLCHSQTMGWLNSRITEKVWKITDISQVLLSYRFRVNEMDDEMSES